MRRSIFRSLAAQPRAVGELARDFPISRPAVSQHLKVLKDVGLVIDRPEGARRVYAAHAPGIAALRTELDRLWNSALAAFKAAVEVPEPTGPTPRRTKRRRKK